MKSLKGKRRARKKAAKRLKTRFTICNIDPEEFRELDKAGKQE